MYIYERKNWPKFEWDTAALTELVAGVRYRQGRLISKMVAMGFSLREEAELQTLTQEVIKTSEIEGEILNPDQVRSSLARRLGIEIAGAVATDRNVDGVVEMMVDATQKFDEPLTAERLFNWHRALFPGANRGMQKMTIGAWRTGENGPMQVVSGGIGKEKVHFEAPDANKMNEEMSAFLEWFNASQPIDPVLKAAIAHLWFVTIHPFEDGNGRVGRAISDMQLARSDDNTQRFYSMSAQIRKERNDYYNVLESTQKGALDITNWLVWFLNCLDRALEATGEILGNVLRKSKFWEEHAAIRLNDRQRLMLDRLLNGIEGKMTSSKWAKMAKCSQDTATRDIQDLIAKNILIKEEAGGRSTSYILKN